MLKYVKEGEKARLKKYRLYKLRALAKSLGIEVAGVNKKDLICKIVESLFVSANSENNFYTEEKICEKDNGAGVKDYSELNFDKSEISSLDFSEWHKRAVEDREVVSGYVCDLGSGFCCVANPFKTFITDDCIRLENDIVLKYGLKLGDFIEIYKDTNEIFGINRRPAELIKKIPLEKLKVEQSNIFLEFGEVPEKVNLQFSLFQGEKYLFCGKSETINLLTKRFVESLCGSQAEYYVNLVSLNGTDEYLELFNSKELLNIVCIDNNEDFGSEENFNKLMLLLYRIESILETNQDGVVIIEDLGSLLNVLNKIEKFNDYQKSILFNIGCKIKNGGSITVLANIEEKDLAVLNSGLFYPTETIWVDSEGLPISAPKNYKKKKQ